MLDAIKRLWRHMCIAFADKELLTSRLEDAEARIYCLEQDMRRMIATVRSNSQKLNERS